MSNNRIVSPSPDEFDDDMDDNKLLGELRARADNGETGLRGFIAGLELVNDQCLATFRESDKKALQYQRWYRRLAVASMLTGAIAVLLSLFQLSPGTNSSPAVPWLELIAATLSLAIVLTVILLQTKQKWLLRRAQAERLRRLKFEAMLDPKFWDKTAHAALEARLKHAVSEMFMQSENIVEHWAQEVPTPADRSAPKHAGLAEAKEFRAYYRRQRVESQLRYLKKNYPRERRRNLRTKPVGPILFYASVVVVAGHFLLHRSEEATNETNWVLQTIVFLAAGLPALGAFFRIHRDTREYGRNSLRHQATYNALNQLLYDLNQETTADGIFRKIGFCEHVLEADTHEWMRLFSETEWFG